MTVPRAALSDSQVAAIEAMQERFLDGSDAGPMVMTCSGALESGKNSRNLLDICEKFLREYGQAKIALLSARTARAAQTMPMAPPTNATALPRSTQHADQTIVSWSSAALIEVPAFVATPTSMLA
ncbi:hypothetical protein [Cupriavidus pampae]|nr:hypothetical protein [Cupriavidus pampae]